MKNPFSVFEVVTIDPAFHRGVPRNCTVKLATGQTVQARYYAGTYLFF